MPFSINHNKLCPICNKNIVDGCDSARSSTLRCLECHEVFFICGNCLGCKCPKCKSQLVSKSETSPDNLFLAIDKNNLDELKGLFAQENIRSELNIDSVVNEKGDSLLSYAAIKQSYEICEYLVKDCHILVNEKNSGGRTALIEMIRCRGAKCSIKIINLLAGSVNERDSAGKTALMFASVGAGLFGSKKGNIGIVKRLLSLNADLTLESKAGCTALGYAIESNKQSKASNNKEVVCYLEQEMLKSIAMKEFRRLYDYTVSIKGVIDFSKK